MGLYLGLPQDNYPGRRPQAPACFKYLSLSFIQWIAHGWPVQLRQLQDPQLLRQNASEFHASATHRKVPDIFGWGIPTL